MGLIRNQVYGSPVPWVRIPPSPPEIENGALVAPFLISRRVWLRMRTLFDSGSGVAASEAAKRPSHPVRQNYQKVSCRGFRPAFTELPRAVRCVPGWRKIAGHFAILQKSG